MKIYFQFINYIGVLVFLLFSNPCLSGEFKPLFPGYPETFTNQSVVDFVGDDHFVINDYTYLITNQSKFHTSSGLISKDFFKKGDEIGIIVDKENNNNILSVWLISKGKIKHESTNKQGSLNTIRLIDGKYVN